MSRLKNICVLGGTGFVGQAIVRRLAKLNYNIKVLTRRREAHRELLVLPGVDLVEADIQERNCLNEQFENMHAVINLVGILNELDKQKRSFQGAHVNLARLVVDACQRNKISRLLHMSAINADANRGASKYLRSKGEAENIVHTTNKLYVTTFRPSVIFGPADDFLNRFARMLNMLPGFMPVPLACGNSKMQPIYVEDVSRVFVHALTDKESYGQRYNLCGPKQYTLAELVAYTSLLGGRKRKIIPLGESMSMLQSLFLGKMLTTDNILSMRTDSICTDNALLETFGINPTSLETVAPDYIGKRSLARRKDILRQSAGR